MESMDATSSSGGNEAEELLSPVLESDVTVPTFSSSVNVSMAPITDQAEATEQSLDTESTGYQSEKKTNSDKVEDEVNSDETESKLVTDDESKPVTDEAKTIEPPVSFNLVTLEQEKSQTISEPPKENFVSEFHKFLQNETAANAKESGESQIDYVVKETDGSNNQDTKDTKPFNPISEDTSNSSWYKLKPDDQDQLRKMDAVNLPQDETSNLSLMDNASCASSNIGEGTFHEQTSNVDECSNLSMPDDGSILQYSGHQPVFDESANMNPPSNLPCTRPDTPNSEKDKSTSELTPAKKFRRGTLQIAADDANEHGHGLTASDIYEYMWPQEGDGEFYMLQEQISLYLDVKSFKRKYPDLFRRTCDKHEKDFLRDKGVVSETQSDLGLTALKADEVHELMGRDYPAMYKEYVKVLQDREKQIHAEKIKEIQALKMEKDKMIEYTKKAMKSVSDWNRNMLKERNEERRAYFDMQTFTIQYPRNKFRKLMTMPAEIGAYPLAIIPGQFQDYYKNYGMEELKSLPINTALVNPLKQSGPQSTDEAQSEQVGESESEDDSSSSSSSDDGSGDEADTGSRDKSTSRERSKEASAEQSIKIKKENDCRICKEEPVDKQKETEHEEIIECSECKSKGHPSCLDLTGEMVKVIRTYPWQCMECKTCVQCMDPYDEDKMLFCDKCDRGYHTFCVGLKSLPTGQWDCSSCRGDTTPIKPLPKPPTKSSSQPKKKKKKYRDPNTPRRPPGRPPKDPAKLEAYIQATEELLKEDIENMEKTGVGKMNLEAMREKIKSLREEQQQQQLQQGGHHHQQQQGSQPQQSSSQQPGQQPQPQQQIGQVSQQPPQIMGQQQPISQQQPMSQQQQPVSLQQQPMSQQQQPISQQQQPVSQQQQPISQQQQPVSLQQQPVSQQQHYSNQQQGSSDIAEQQTSQQPMETNEADDQPTLQQL